jgi:hypothetical protein
MRKGAIASFVQQTTNNQKLIGISLRRTCLFTQGSLKSVNTAAKIVVAMLPLTSVISVIDVLS